MVREGGRGLTARSAHLGQHDSYWRNARLRQSVARGPVKRMEGRTKDHTRTGYRTFVLWATDDGQTHNQNIFYAAAELPTTLCLALVGATEERKGKA